MKGRYLKSGSSATTNLAFGSIMVDPIVYDNGTKPGIKIWREKLVLVTKYRTYFVNGSKCRILVH